MKKSLTVAVAAISVVVTCVVLPSSSSAEAPAPQNDSSTNKPIEPVVGVQDLIPTFEQLDNDDDVTTMDNQDKLGKIGEYVQSRFGASSLTGIVVNPVTNGIWIWFYPEIPSDIFKLDAKHPDVNFSFNISKYSRATLEDAINKIVEKADTLNRVISAISLPPDGSGLKVIPQAGVTRLKAAEFVESLNLNIATADIVFEEPDYVATSFPAVVASYFDILVSLEGRPFHVPGAYVADNHPGSP